MKKNSLLLITYLLLITSSLCSQNVIVLKDINKIEDLMYFPVIKEFCNQSYPTDDFYIENYNVTIRLRDSLNRMVVFNYLGKDVNLFLNSGNLIKVSLDQINNEILFKGDDAKCHEAYNSIAQSSKRYHYDYISNINMSIAPSIGKTRIEQLDEVILEEIALLKDILQKGGCSGKMYQYYFTDIFSSLIFAIKQSNFLGDETSQYIKDLIVFENIDFNIVKGVPSNILFYSAFYYENKDFENEVNIDFLKNRSYILNAPIEIQNYLLQVHLVFDYRTFNIEDRTFSFLISINDLLGYIYFEEFFREKLGYISHKQ